MLLDDIIFTGNTYQVQLENLHQVLEQMRDYNMRAEVTKCEFFQESLTYCGHRIEKQALHKMPDKIDGVVNTPKPMNVTH